MLASRRRTQARRQNPTAAAFGAAIREERSKRGVSQERLAKLAGINRSYMSNIEGAVSVPTLQIVLRLAGALQMKGAQLVEICEQKLEPEEHGRASNPTKAKSKKAWR